MEKRRRWRAQEGQVVVRWNTAVARYEAVLAEIARVGVASPTLALEVDGARAELEAVRRQVARLKVEYNSGKRY